MNLKKSIFFFKLRFFNLRFPFHSNCKKKYFLKNHGRYAFQKHIFLKKDTFVLHFKNKEIKKKNSKKLRDIFPGKSFCRPRNIFFENEIFEKDFQTMFSKNFIWALLQERTWNLEKNFPRIQQEWI